MVGLFGYGLSMLLFGLSTELWMLFASRALSGVLSAAALGFIFLSFAGTYPAVLIATGFFSLVVTFLRPSIHSLTSQRATVGQGTALGLSNSFVSLGRIVGALWAGMLFDLGMDYPYWSGAVILLAGCLLAIFKLRPDPPAHQVPH